MITKRFHGLTERIEAVLMTYIKRVRQNISKGTVIALTVAVLFTASGGDALASLILLDPMEAVHPSRVIRGGEIVKGRQGSGWRATLEQDDEVAGVVHQSIDYRKSIINGTRGTLDFLIERVEPSGNAVKFETLAAFVNSDNFQAGKYDP